MYLLLNKNIDPNNKELVYLKEIEDNYYNNLTLVRNDIDQIDCNIDDASEYLFEQLFPENMYNFDDMFLDNVNCNVII